jgi:3-phosphoshikimate 1-carboxyvinyltransferase
VEGDHSTASYWLAAAAAVGGEVRVGNLKPDSPQPDSRFPAILEALGCAVERGESWIRVRGTGRVASFDLDLRGTPDLVPTLGVLALFSEGVCHLRGIGHLRYKESDRLQVLAEGLGALGARVRPCGEGLTVAPGPLRGARLRTAGDHRMAMAFAIAGLRIEGVSIEDPECVSKSHPAFWEQLAVLERRV